MDNLTEIENRLWDYIDGNSNATEKAEVEKLIAANMEWRAKYHELLEANSLMNLAELEEPSLRFTKNVMEEIARLQIAPATKNYINKKIIWGIGAFFLTAILGFVIYAIGQVNWNAASDSKSAIGIDLSQVDYSAMFNSTFMNIFMMVNIVLGLMLLDRYLAKKRKEFIKEA